MKTRCRKIEAALDGQDVGYEVTLDLQPHDAFGERDERLVRTIPKTEFPPGVKLGGQLDGHNDDGTRQSFTVTKIKGPTVFWTATTRWPARPCAST